MEGTKHLLFIVNPVSGGVNKSKLIHSLKDLSSKYKFSYRIVETQGKNDHERVDKMVKSYHPDCVVAVGGDGTCNLVLSIIQGTKIPLGIIPQGSANGMATELNIPHNTEAALNLILKGNTRLIDVLMVNNQYPCIHFSDIGLNARIVKDFHEDHKRGFFSYAKHLVKEIRRSHTDNFDIKLDKLKTTRKAHMIAFANAKKYGTGAILNQKGKIDDGKFEIVIVKSFTIFTIIDVLMSIFTGIVHASKHIEIIRTRNASVYSRVPQLLQVDGEMTGKFKRIDVTLLPGNLYILC